MINRLFSYFSLSYAELKKVTWPTRRQAFQLTLIVIGFSVVLAIIVGGLDAAVRAFLQQVILKVR